MNPIESYTPQYVLRLQQQTDPCGCQSCQRQPALVTLRWQNQLRHSALLSCDRAAREILCREDAFVLYQEDAACTDEAPLSERQLAVNQGCINLLIAGDADLRVKLYTLGIFLSKVSPLERAEQILSIEQSLCALLQQGEMTRAFAQLPAINNYKLAALRTLSECDLDADLDPLTGMTLVLKLNEMKLLNASYLEESLGELEDAARQTAFIASQQSVLLNALLWECYHHVFPAGDAADWQQVFHRLCQRYFSLTMLSAIFVQNQLELSEDNLAALFAAWQRALTPAAASEDALLVGLSLLK